MRHPVLGLHHVTATVDDAQDDLDLCIKALGLRLVKKTVNFDNHRHRVRLPPSGASMLDLVHAE